MKSILEYLENTTRKMPNKIAAVDENGSITYIELTKSAQKIGTSMLRIGKMKNKPIPVLMEKGITALQTFLGIVYAGGFYVLLNPELPQPRLKQIVEVLSPELIITDNEHLALAEQLSDTVFCYQKLLRSCVDENLLTNAMNLAMDIDPLYANFTSGSTGTPKGVLISHRSVIDFIDHFTELFEIDSTDVIGNQAPFDFDVSVKDIYSAISTGATLVIIPKTLFVKPAELIDFICEYRITTMIWAVSALCLISTFHGLDYRIPDTVKRILFSGEIMPQKHLKIWMKKMPDTEFVNLYGPTEITCNCTYYRMDRTHVLPSVLPIGIPFPNEKVFLLNEDDSMITTPETIGEICVGGAGLALGYYGDDQLTKQKFIQNPINRSYYERIYRTGDLGYYDLAGNLCFSGRKDFQIKHMGHRIELEDIERTMMQHDGVTQACCVFDEDKSRLYAAFVGTVLSSELHSMLSAELPVYMVPRKIICLKSMPLTKNGKTDRREVLTMVVKQHD